MRMSTKARYAVNALIDLALHGAAGPVTLVTISARQQVSLSSLEQLFSRLRREGIVLSTRGPGGGYTLCRLSVQITVADIIAAVDDQFNTADGEIANAGLSQALWQRLYADMMQHMATITLQSLVDKQKADGVLLDAKPVRRGIAPQPAAAPLPTTAANSVFAFGRTLAR